MKHKTKFFSFLLFVSFFLIQEGCKRDISSIDVDLIEGDYMFIEKFIYSYAKQISGHCDIGIAFQPHTIYKYDNVDKTLDYKLRPEFDVNEQLKTIVATKHIFAPLSGPFSAYMTLTPIYFLPDTANGIYLTEDNIIELNLNFKTIQERIVLLEDSTIIRVLKTIENGIVEQSFGDSCIWEYTDSLVIRNYGLNPKDKINRISQ